jgi:DNA-binding MarR family transcriptional regulator
MDANAAAGREPQDAPRAARELIELLEVLWERGKDLVPSNPVSASQLRVLYSLDREEGINLRALGELLGSTPPSVSRLCDRLEALGYVQRTASPVSRREVELHLTTHGRTYLRILRAKRQDALQEVIAEMTPAERKALLAGLTSFQDALDEAGSVSRREAAGDDARSA